MNFEFDIQVTGFKIYTQPEAVEFNRGDEITITKAGKHPFKVGTNGIILKVLDGLRLMVEGQDAEGNIVRKGVDYEFIQSI